MRGRGWPRPRWRGSCGPRWRCWRRVVTAILERVSSLACSPRWTTPRTDRPTRGGEVGRFAAALGTPLMPWQQHVADVAMEVDPDTGRLVYRRIVLTVPRQSGKTTLLLAKM